MRAVVSRSTPLNEGSADPAAVSPPLRPDPTGRIAVPFMIRVPQGAQRDFDLIPPLLILKRLPDGRCDEGAPATAPNPSIESGDQFVLQAYVQAHGHSLAHKGWILASRPTTAPKRSGCYSLPTHGSIVV